jgi:hypothetical protein
MTDKNTEDAVARIANQHLGLYRLNTRSANHLDFSSHAVWSIKEALTAAYTKGWNDRAQDTGEPDDS